MSVLGLKIKVANTSKRGDDKSFILAVTMWEELANEFSTLEKGDRIVVDGRLSVESYTAKDGLQREFPRLTAASCMLMGCKPPAQAQAPAPASTASFGGGDPGSDIPF